MKKQLSYGLIGTFLLTLALFSVVQADSTATPTALKKPRSGRPGRSGYDRQIVQSIPIRHPTCTRKKVKRTLTAMTLPDATCVTDWPMRAPR